MWNNKNAETSAEVSKQTPLAGRTSLREADTECWIVEDRYGPVKKTTQRKLGEIKMEEIMNMKMNMETYTNGVVKVKENLDTVTLEAKKLGNGKTIQVASLGAMTFKRVHGQPGQFIAAHPIGAATEEVIAGLEMLKKGGYLESYEQFMLDFQLQFSVNQGLSDIKGREIFYNPPDSAEFSSVLHAIQRKK